MRLLLTFGCVATCLAIGGRFAWNALELDAWAAGSNTLSMSSLLPQSREPAPDPEPIAMLAGAALVPTIMLPKADIPDKLTNTAHSSFGSRGVSSARLMTIVPSTPSSGIVVPSSARASNKPAARTPTYAAKSKIGAYESSPSQAYGFNRRNPLTTALSGRNYTKPHFNFTSTSRKQNSGSTSRKYSR